MIEIREPANKEEFNAYYNLRYEVLRKPWNQPPGSEKDDKEDESIHFAAFENKKIIGVCRLQYNNETEAQIRFMAVNPNTQGKGIGKKLLYAAEKRALNDGKKIMILQARKNAVNFYKACGYTIKEKTFLLWNEIQHYLMEKKLNIIIY
jgi:predicted GNAT family N-acyltransferase